MKPHRKRKHQSYEEFASTIPKVPSHLKHLEKFELLDEDCKWSLSGAQFSHPTPIQLRYCYPKGPEEYSRRKGAALWTKYLDDGKEDKNFRILHVYYSAKRALNNGIFRNPKVDDSSVSELPKRTLIKHRTVNNHRRIVSHDVWLGGYSWDDPQQRDSFSSHQWTRPAAIKNRMVSHDVLLGCAHPTTIKRRVVSHDVVLGGDTWDDQQQRGNFSLHRWNPQNDIDPIFFERWKGWQSSSPVDGTTIEKDGPFLKERVGTFSWSFSENDDDDDNEDHLLIKPSSFFHVEDTTIETDNSDDFDQPDVNNYNNSNNNTYSNSNNKHRLEHMAKVPDHKKIDLEIQSTFSDTLTSSSFDYASFEQDDWEIMSIER